MQKYFSVKKSVNIAGKTYMPCICYPLTEYLKLTIEKLAQSGTAVIYDKKVAFQNGKLVEKGNAGRIVNINSSYRKTINSTTLAVPVSQINDSEIAAEEKSVVEKQKKKRTAKKEETFYVAEDSPVSEMAKASIEALESEGF